MVACRQSYFGSEMPWRRVSIPQRFLAPNGLRNCAIQFKGNDRGATGGAKADNSDSLPTEVNSPPIPAGIKQRNCASCFRISSRLSGSLPQGTRDASQRKIFGYRCPAGVGRYHMVNMERSLLAQLRKPAVLAAIFCALDDLTPKAQRDVHAVMPGDATARNAFARAKGRRLNRQGLRLRASQQQSKYARSLACPKGFEGVEPLLLAGGTSPSHQAFQFRVGRLETYFNCQNQSKAFAVIFKTQVQDHTIFSRGGTIWALP